MSRSAQASSRRRRRAPARRRSSRRAAGPRVGEHHAPDDADAALEAAHERLVDARQHDEQGGDRGEDRQGPAQQAAERTTATTTATLGLDDLQQGRALRLRMRDDRVHDRRPRQPGPARRAVSPTGRVGPAARTLFTDAVWPDSAEVLPAAFAGSGVTVVAFRPHSVEPSGHGFLYGYEVDTVDAAGVTATVLTFIDTDVTTADASSARSPPTPPRASRSPSGRTRPTRCCRRSPGSPTPTASRAPSPSSASRSRRPPSASPRTGRASARSSGSTRRGDALPQGRPARPGRARSSRCTRRSSRPGLPVPARARLARRRAARPRAGPRRAGGQPVLELADDPRFVASLVDLGRRIAPVAVTQRARADAIDHAAWHRRTLTPRCRDEREAIDGPVRRDRAAPRLLVARDPRS